MHGRLWIFVLVVFSTVDGAVADATGQRAFTSRDAAEMAYFGNIAVSTLKMPYDDGTVCPTNRYAIKITHRGVLPEGVTEGTVWLFDIDDVLRAVKNPDSQPTAPVALASVAGAVNGIPTDFVNRANTILHPKWSADCQHVYFLGRDRQENRQLFKVDVRSLHVEVITPRDRDVFAYSVAGSRIALLIGEGFEAEDRWRIEGSGVDDISIGTGTALNPLLFPNFREYANVEPLNLEVWTTDGDVITPVINNATSESVRVTTRLSKTEISVSPDGREAVAIAYDAMDQAANSTYRLIDLKSGGFRDIDSVAELRWTPFAARSVGDDKHVDFSIHEGPNQPPVLMATDLKSQVSREIFDPNPQLASVELLPIEVFRWRDKHGRDIVGGLIKPAGFDSDVRYPLVIQTHGFDQNRFFSVGYSETASAGRALASRGIVVLQVQEPDAWGEVPMNLDKAGLDIYSAAIDALASLGIIDADKVGISGYSLTGLTVASSISRAPDKFSAAVVANADPLTLTGYYSYVDSPLEGLVEKLFVGDDPQGDGLEVWTQKSPSLSTASIGAPVLVAASDPFHLLSLWDFYAALRYQGKPVELQFIRSGQHNLTKPLHRVAHQELIVDWFDFWLNDNKDGDSRKANRYKRWRAMRGSQHADE